MTADVSHRQRMESTKSQSTTADGDGPASLKSPPSQLATKTAPMKPADFDKIVVGAPPTAPPSTVSSSPLNGNFNVHSSSGNSNNTGKPSLSGTLHYEAPTKKPFPPGIRKDSEITLPNSRNICHALPTDAYLRDEMISGQCTICLDSLVSHHELAVSLNACGHVFHRHCLRETMKHQCSHRCPECRALLLSDWDRITYLRGNMPSGTLSWKTKASVSCAGYEGCGSICLSYNILNSNQKSYHPNPGQLHRSAFRTAYLPDNQEGWELLSRLQVAFLCGLTFNVGTSLTTNRDNSVTWASIHHKTSPTGGIERHGYPDENYMSNCNSELDTASVPPSEICAEYVSRGMSVSSKGDPYRQTLLFHLMHAQHCKNKDTGPCLVVKQCSKFKALLQHVHHCIDNACSFHHCAAAKAVLGHFADNYPQCQSRRGCGLCGLVRSAMTNAQNTSKCFGELKYQDLPSYVSVSNLPADRSDAKFFYQQNVQDVFHVPEGSHSCHLSPMLSQINSDDFKQFLEQDKLLNPTVVMNPHTTLAMCQVFLEEGIKCCAEADDLYLRVVFHGTPEVNIESILHNGLDQSKRKGQKYGPGEYFSSSPVKCARHCCGGQRIIVFAVITTNEDIKTGEIVVVEKPQRQLPIATLQSDSIDSLCLVRRSSAYLRKHQLRQTNFPRLTGRGQLCDADSSANASPRKLLKEKIEKEKLANEAREKENIIRLLLENSYQSASDTYKKACNTKKQWYAASILGSGSCDVRLGPHQGREGHNHNVSKSAPAAHRCVGCDNSQHRKMRGGCKRGQAKVRKPIKRECLRNIYRCAQQTTFFCNFATMVLSTLIMQDTTCQSTVIVLQPQVPIFLILLWMHKNETI